MKEYARELEADAGLGAEHGAPGGRPGAGAAGDGGRGGPDPLEPGGRAAPGAAAFGVEGDGRAQEQVKALTEGGAAEAPAGGDRGQGAPRWSLFFDVPRLVGPADRRGGRAALERRRPRCPHRPRVRRRWHAGRIGPPKSPLRQASAAADARARPSALAAPRRDEGRRRRSRLHRARRRPRRRLEPDAPGAQARSRRGWTRRVGPREGQAPRRVLGRLPHLPPHLRDDPLPPRLERRPGAALARPPQAELHARHLRPPARRGRARADVLRRAHPSARSETADRGAARRARPSSDERGHRSTRARSSPEQRGRSPRPSPSKADWKHWYAVEAKHADDPDFRRFAELIEARGLRRPL